MRAAISTYVETFVLIGVAVGGASVIFGAASAYTSPARGPSVSIDGASIRQGAYLAVERLTVYDSGDTPVSSFTVSTLGVSGSSLYCYTLTAPPSGAVVATDCPPASPGPSSVMVQSSISPGKALQVELILTGVAFASGSTATVTVTASDGAQSSAAVQVVGA